MREASRRKEDNEMGSMRNPGQKGENPLRERVREMGEGRKSHRDDFQLSRRKKDVDVGRMQASPSARREGGKICRPGEAGARLTMGTELADKSRSYRKKE